MSVQCAESLARPGVPQIQRPLVPGRGEHLAVRRQGDPADPFMAQTQSFAAVREFPESHRVVARGRGQRFAIGGEVQPPNRTAVLKSHTAQPQTGTSGEGLVRCGRRAGGAETDGQHGENATQQGLAHDVTPRAQPGRFRSPSCNCGEGVQRPQERPPRCLKGSGPRVAFLRGRRLEENPGGRRPHAGEGEGGVGQQHAVQRQTRTVQQPGVAH